jgi:hypothetical protein
MALADAVQGSRYIAQQITWTDEDGTAVDLTGATLTGRIRSLDDRNLAPRAIDGTLTPDPDQVNNIGDFSWAYGATDVGTAGSFQVQFIATFVGGLSEKTLLEEWTVHAAI